jgi:hypothetical protein
MLRIRIASDWECIFKRKKEKSKKDLRLQQQATAGTAGEQPAVAMKKSTSNEVAATAVHVRYMSSGNSDDRSNRISRHSRRDFGNDNINSSSRRRPF